MSGWRRVFGGERGGNGVKIVKNVEVGEGRGGGKGEGGSKRGETAASRKVGKTHRFFL